MSDYKKHAGVEFDKDKWASASEYKPTPFHLVEVEDIFGRRQKAWWTGSRWDYGRRKINKNILKWRAVKEGTSI